MTSYIPNKKHGVSEVFDTLRKAQINRWEISQAKRAGISAPSRLIVDPMPIILPDQAFFVVGSMLEAALFEAYYSYLVNYTTIEATYILRGNFSEFDLGDLEEAGISYIAVNSFEGPSVDSKGMFFAINNTKSAQKAIFLAEDQDEITLLDLDKVGSGSEEANFYIVSSRGRAEELNSLFPNSGIIDSPEFLPMLLVSGSLEFPGLSLSAYDILPWKSLKEDENIELVVADAPGLVDSLASKQSPLQIIKVGGDSAPGILWAEGLSTLQMIKVVSISDLVISDNDYVLQLACDFNKPYIKLPPNFGKNAFDRGGDIIVNKDTLLQTKKEGPVVFQKISLLLFGDCLNLRSFS